MRFREDCQFNEQRIQMSSTAKALFKIWNNLTVTAQKIIGQHLQFLVAFKGVTQRGKKF